MASSDDLELIAEFGSQIIGDVMTLGVNLLSYGLYFVLFVTSTRILLQRWKESRSSSLLLGLSTVLFLSQTIRMPTFIYLTVLDVKTLLMMPTIPLADRFDVLSVPGGRTIPIIHWTRAFTLIVADGAVVWRASMMPNVNKHAILGLTGFMIFNACMLLIFPMIRSISPDWNFEHQDIMTDIIGSSYLTSTLTNLFATGIIAVSAWKHNNSLKGFVGSARNPQVLKVLITFVETGLIFVLLQLTNTLLAWVPPLDDVNYLNALSIIDELVLSFAAISPVIVILVVQSGRSILGTSEGPSSIRAQAPASYNLSSTNKGASSFGGTTKRDSFGMSSADNSVKDLEKALSSN